MFLECVSCAQRPFRQAFANGFLFPRMDVRWMAGVDRDDHAKILKLAERSTLSVPKPRPLGTIKGRELNEDKGKVTLSPLLTPLLD